MKKRMALLMLAALALLPVAADVQWLEREYDFGLMKEIAGPVTGRARFVNTGPEAVTVISARPSCGCTEATYPHSPVEPGDTAVITFTYDPAGRPGRFDKSVKVRFADGRRQNIRIIGNVLGTPESLAQFYPVEAGPFRLSEDRVMLGNVARDKASTGFVNMCNQLVDSVPVTVRSNDPALKLTLSERKAGPGDIVTVGIYFDSHRRGHPGPFDIPLTISATAPDGTPHEHVVRVAGTVVPQRKAVSARELAKAPVAVAAPPVIDLGNFTAGPIEFASNIVNDGNSQLEILSVWCDAAQVKVGKYPQKIKPGKTGRITLTLDVSEVPVGAFRTFVNVATNDPVNPLLKLPVGGIRE